MTVPFIKKVTAWKCPLHQAVLLECGNALQQHGYVNKDHVISRLKLEAVQSAIRWDYVVDFLGDPNSVWNIPVLPVAERFFKERVYNKSGQVMAGRYIASGHGKKTAGYIRATLQGGQFLLWHADQMIAQANGIGKSLGRVITKTHGDPEIEQAIADRLPRTDVAGLIKLLGGTP